MPPDAEAAALAERLLDLWRVPPQRRADPQADFAALYTDPVVVNGAPLTIADLVARAEALHAAFTDHELELVEIVAQPGKVAIAIRHTARHTGPWATPLGELAATGRTVTATIIDILTVEDGRVRAVVMVADELGRLMQLGALGRG